MRAADEQPRQLDGRDRRDHADPRRLPEHAQLGSSGRASEFSIRHTEAVTQRVHEARRVLDLSVRYYEQFKRFGDQLASERCSERYADLPVMPT
ncbi:MAG TPA: DUF932 domain-containing protein [Solirubrobacteraceae bacterium]